METPIGVLRIEQNQVSKELSRFRACDPETRSLYCREWAQYIYKKHFVWNAKTQEEVPDSRSVPTSLSAGKYQINFILDNDTDEDDEEAAEERDVYRKEHSALMSKKFEELVESWSSTPGKPEEESLINQVLHACQLWITLPSGYSGLPDLFEPVEFNPYPDAIPLTDDPKDPSQLLDALIIERQALCLPSNCFHLLKNLTGDILLSHTTPTCNHTRPTSRAPSDLDVDRNIFNENESVAVKKALAELTTALENVWKPLNGFLEKLNEFEKRRSRLMGKECQSTIDSFVVSQKFVPFLELWTLEEPKYKNKKSTPEAIAQVDEYFEQYLNHLKSLINGFMDEFVPAHMKDIQVLTADLWQMIVPTIYQMGERMASHEDQKGNKSDNATKVGESLKALNIDSLKRMESTKEVNAAQTRIIDSINARKNRYMIEIDNLLKHYRETGRNTLHGRIEKFSNRDFKKKLKKTEGSYEKLCQYFVKEVTENIFPETLFCKFSLVCLEPLMQEGEVMEAVTIEREVKRFVESHRNLLQQRCALLHDFEEGVQTGRRELAGILGKLFLKEGMRIQGENAALKKQNSLLKSMGLPVNEPAPTKKKSKNKKKTASGANSSGANSNSSTPTMVSKDLPTSVSSDKNTVTANKKKDVVTSPSSKPTATKEQKAPSKSASPEPVAKSVTEPAAEKSPKTDVSVPINTTQSNNTNKNSGKASPVVQSNTPVTSKPKKSLIASPKSEASPKQAALPAKNDDDAQDWETIRASVLASKSSKEGGAKDEVQDWEALKVNIQKKEEKEPAKETKKEKTENTDDWKKAATGWSIVASKKPSSTSTTTTDNWSTAATVNTSEASSTKEDDLGGWGSPMTANTSTSAAWSTTSTDGWNTSIENKKQNDGWNTPAKEKKKPVAFAAAAAATATTTTTTTTTTSAWDAPSSNLPASNENGGLSLGGWGSASTTDSWDKPATSGAGNQSKPMTTSSSVPSSGIANWGKTATPPPTKDNWAKATASSSAATESWNTAKPSDKKQSSGGDSWGTSGASVADNWGKSATLSSNDDGWGTASSSAKQISKSGWDSSKLSWNDKPTLPDTKTIKTPAKEAVKKTETALASAPPGISAPTSAPPPPPPSLSTTTTPAASIGQSMPPGLSAGNDQSNKKVEELSVAPNPPNTTSTTTTTTNVMPTPGLNATGTPATNTGLGVPFLSSGTVQLQEPLPANINEMSTDMLLLIVKNLHRENGTLIQSVYSMQQEMSMMTNRYAEIMALAREREAQTLALFESRKQTEMEEARRYVLSLEARVKELEEQINKTNNATSMATAGFGNQDLFAGYREEMSTTSHHHHHNNHGRNIQHNRKLWQKNNIIRCGNCGEMGHASAECKSYCRYCGSLEHLSEACPMN
ncbi:MAG: hypothetical protein EXX96DRAFT_247738 [Benjaminiella poitrasii]|nr:MAG: hypothetical protein EXX96DRAFT_247738 [Benjaminiella poitrasii]